MKRLLSVLLVLVMVSGCFVAFAEEDSWVCPGCGWSNTTNFCIKCGTKRPDQIVCPGCGMVYASDTDVAYCGECGTKLLQEKEPELDPSRYEGSGFDTPEDAALCYFAGIRNLDFEQILSAFAWETQADHFDFKAFVSRIKSANPVMVPGMPAANDLLRSAMVEQLRGHQTNSICKALEYYVNNEIFTSKTNSLVFWTDEELEAYYERCDNGKIESLADMYNFRFYTPDDLTEGRFSLGRNPENYLKQNAKFGADETKDVVIAADIGGETVIAAPTIARYGDRWYLVDVSSMTLLICGIQINCMAFFVLPDEFEEALKGVTPARVVSELPSASERKYRYEGDGFSSPEEAVSCYVDGLKNGDVGQMLRAFAWETQAGRYSLTDYVRRMQSITASAPVRMEARNAFMTEMNLGSLRYLQGRRIYTALWNYVLKDEARFSSLLEGFQISLTEEEEADAFVRAFDNDKVDTLKQLGDVRLVEPSMVIDQYNPDAANKQLDSYQRIYGADEIMETLAVAGMGEETLVFNPLLARYDDKWYIVSVNGIAFSSLAINAGRQAFFTVEGTPEQLPGSMSF